MRAFKVFIFGLLFGWFIKVAFDRIYRENEIEDIRNENRSLQDYVRSLETRLEPKSLESKSLQRSAPRTLPAEASDERQDTPAQTPEKDDLKVIKGIGPVIERKLNNAGIQTFATLSKLKAGELENILGSQVKRLQDENDLIAQAKKLAKKK